MFISAVPVIVIVSPDASPKIVLPLTVKSCTSAIVTFLLPITTSIVAPLGGVFPEPNVNVVPLTLYLSFA